METYVVLDTIDTILDRSLLTLDYINTGDANLVCTTYITTKQVMQSPFNLLLGR